MTNLLPIGRCYTCGCALMRQNYAGLFCDAECHDAYDSDAFDDGDL